MHKYILRTRNAYGFESPNEIRNKLVRFKYKLSLFNRAKNADNSLAIWHSSTDRGRRSANASKREIRSTIFENIARSTYILSPMTQMWGDSREETKRKYCSTKRHFGDVTRIPTKGIRLEGGKSSRNEFVKIFSGEWTSPKRASPSSSFLRQLWHRRHFKNVPGLPESGYALSR